MATMYRKLLLVLLGLVLFALIGRELIWPPVVTSEIKPVGVMGTTCRIVAVGEEGYRMTAVLARAESELHRIEVLMSTWIDDSEVSRINASGSGLFQTALDVDEVMIYAERIYQQSDSAFDVTAKPIFDLWKQSAARGTVPTREQIHAAREGSSWDWLRVNIGTGGVIKWKSTVQVEVAGLAKGYAVDKALAAMRERDLKGALVEVGGDIACFGKQADGSPWRVKVKNPFGEGTVMTLALPEGGAVCTSGNYARYYEIAGKRYSQIIDPRTGWPAEAAASVTVIAPDCMTADAWATALSVLGPEGLVKIDAMDGIEAMLITGEAEDHQYHDSAGFRRYVVNEP